MASGFSFAYDPSIKQIKYNLEDKKSENISVYFDMAAFQIDKCTPYLMQTSKLQEFWCIVGLESREYASW